MREPKWHVTVLVSLLGMVVIGIIYALIFFYSTLDIGYNIMITLILLALLCLGTFFLFAHSAKKSGHNDCIELSVLYKQIKDKRSHQRNLKNTYQRLI